MKIKIQYILKYIYCLIQRAEKIKVYESHIKQLVQIFSYFFRAHPFSNNRLVGLKLNFRNCQLVLHLTFGFHLQTWHPPQNQLQSTGKIVSNFTLQSSATCGARPPFSGDHKLFDTVHQDRTCVCVAGVPLESCHHTYQLHKF